MAALQTIQLKRRNASDDNAPSSLAVGETAYNEYQQVLYIGKDNGGAGQHQIAGSGIHVTWPGAGFIAQTAARSGATPPTSAARTITGTAGEITVTNGDGVSGNPTLSLASNFGVFGSVTGNTGTATADTPTDSLSIVGSAVNNRLGIVTIAADGPESLTIGLDIVGRTALGAAPATTDSLLLYDLSTTTNKKLSIANLFASPALTGTPTAPTAAKATNTTQIATTAFVKSQDVNDLAAPAGSFDMNGQKITGLGSPTLTDDAVTKAYADSLAGGFDYKESVELVETGNVSLTGEQTIDGVLTSSSRVLLVGQSSASQNGIYVTASGAWSRSSDANTSAEVTAGMSVFVSEGSARSNRVYTLTTDDPITLDTTSLVFTQTSGLGQITAGTGMTKTGDTIDVIGTASRITANANSIDISASYVGQTSITTLGTITTGTWTADVIADEYGGTGQSTYAQGDILYASAANVLSKLTKGATGTILNMSATIPEWTNTIDGGTY